MKIKKTLKNVETIAVAAGAVVVSATVWWPLGIAGAGYWYYKRRWRKK